MKEFIRWAFVGCALVWLVGCSQGGPEGINTASCERVEPRVSSAVPLERVTLEGVDVFSGDVYATVSTDDGAASVRTVIERQGDGSAALVVPLHPSLDPDGGTVEVTVTDGEVSCPAFSLRIEPMPEAERSFSEAVLDLEHLIATIAQDHGTTIEAFTDTSSMSFPPHLIPVATAYLMIAAPGEPESLLSWAKGEVTTVGGTEVDNELLDRIAALAGLHAVLDDAFALAEGLGWREGPRPLGSGSTLAARPSSSHACTSSYQLFAIDDAATLDRYMQAQNTAESRLGGATGKVIEDTAFVMAFAGKAGPLGAAIATTFGTYAAAVLQTYEAYTHMFPSTISIALSLSQASFDEDEEGPGEWTATATAWSRDWIVNEKIFEAVLEKGLGNASVAKGVLGDDVPKAVQEQIDDYALNRPLKAALGWFLSEIGADDPGAGFNIPAQCWDGIDVSDPQWSDARVKADPDPVIYIFGADNHRLYHPQAVGKGVIEVHTKSGRFGNKMAIATATVEVKKIEVFLSPFQTNVRPGEQVTFTAEVANAQDTGVEWQTSAGYFDTTVAYPDGTHEAVLVTPRDKASFPIEVRAVSTSTGGIRGLEDAPERRAKAGVFISSFDLEIFPSNVLVQAGGGIGIVVAVSAEESMLEEPVEFSLSGAPAGVSHAFNPTASLEGTILDLATATSAPPGTYLLTVHGSSGELAAAASLDLTIVSPDPVADVAGVWTGTVHNLWGEEALELVILQSGVAIEVWATYGDSTWVHNDMPGIVSGDEVTFSRTTGPDGEEVIEYRYEGTVEGDTMKGTFSIIHSEEGLWHQGPFEVAKQ